MILEQQDLENRNTAGNIGLQYGGFSAKLNILNSNVHCANLNICTSNPPLLKAEKRCASF